MGDIINTGSIQARSDWFRWRLVTGAAALELSADCIAGIMHVESGTNPARVNKGYGSTGLIQWMPSVAKASTGYTTSQLRKMSAEAQLELVLQHFARFRGLRGTTDCGEYYMATFLPAYIGAPDSEILGEKDSQVRIRGGLTRGQVYAGNYGFDTDKDGVFTAGEVRNFMRGKVNAWASKPRIPVPDDEPAKPRTAGKKTSLGMVALAIIPVGAFVAMWARK